jgi:hypothetical protein
MSPDGLTVIGQASGPQPATADEVLSTGEFTPTTERADR